MPAHAIDDKSQHRRLVAQERTRCAQLTGVVLPVVIVYFLLTIAISWLTANSRLGVTLAIHLPALSILAIAFVYHRQGHTRWSGWLVAAVTWLSAGVATWFLGGLRDPMACGFLVSVAVAAATVGVRPALFFGAGSVIVVSLIAWAQSRGALPQVLTELSLLNAWITVVIALLVVTGLVYFIRQAERTVACAALATDDESDAQGQPLSATPLPAQKMEPLSRLAAGIAHDFNNLLTVIAGVSNLLRRGPTDRTTVHALLDDLDTAAARATLITGQLLAFSRQRSLDVRVIDANDVVRSMTPLLSRLLGDEVRVNLLVGGEKAPLRCDRNHFEQVILNLAVNARDAMPHGGELTIEVCKIATYQRVLVRVSDNGYGMSGTLLEQVFTPFFTTKPHGTGLGLSTVRDFVQQCGGTIEVQSVPGEGSHFRLFFPLADRTPQTVVSQSLAPASTPGRVLLVEDHELVRRTNRRTLEQAGLEVTAVLDGMEALALLDGGASFDLIVTDMLMPRMNGDDLALRLDERGSQIPLLIVSGNIDHLPHSLQALPYPITFLGKPFSSAVFLQAVQIAIRAAQAPNGLEEDAFEELL